MKNIVIVETEIIVNLLKDIIPKEFMIIPLENKVGGKDICNNLYNIDISESEELSKIYADLKVAPLIFIVYTNDSKFHNMLNYAVKYFNIKQFKKVEISTFTYHFIQDGFDKSFFITDNELEYLIAKVEIDKIIDCQINQLVRWFFIDKRKILTKEEMEDVYLTRLIIYAIDLLSKVEHNIETFYPEIFRKIYADYNYDGIQFRVKNNTKFNEDMDAEVNSLLSISANKENENIVDEFNMDTKERKPFKLFDTLSLQRSCNYLFYFEPKYIMEIADELHNGVEIENETVSLITNPRTKNISIKSFRELQIRQRVKDMFNKEYYYDGDRNAIDDSVHEKEAIVPELIHKDEFIPENIKKFLSEDQFKIYEYIYQRTIASQMSNMISDATKLSVTIAGNKFKANASNIIFDGWYKLGQYWKDKSSDENRIQDVILPKSLYAGQKLNYIDVGIYETPERTPFRYGIGRFIEKATKDIDSDESEITQLPEYLINKKLVDIYQNMIHPTPLCRQIHKSLEHFIPDLISSEFREETNKELENIRVGKENKDLLIDKFLLMVEKFKTEVEYKSSDSKKPNEVLVKKAKQIAKENNQELTDTITKNKTLLNSYVLENDSNIHKLGVCIKCGSGEIYQHDKGFSCNNNDCSFVIWNNSIKSFLSYFQKSILQENYIDIISAIVNTGKFHMDELYNRKKESFFSADLVLEYSEQYKKWQLSLSFGNNKDKQQVENNTKPVSQVEKENDFKKLYEENNIFTSVLIGIDSKDNYTISDLDILLNNIYNAAREEFGNNFIVIKQKEYIICIYLDNDISKIKQDLLMLKFTFDEFQQPLPFTVSVAIKSKINNQSFDSYFLDLENTLLIAFHSGKNIIKVDND